MKPKKLKAREVWLHWRSDAGYWIECNCEPYEGQVEPVCAGDDRMLTREVLPRRKKSEGAMSKVPASFDAKDWAEEFCKLVRKKPEIATDEGTMIEWFAAALMRGYDEANRRRDALRRPASGGGE